MYVHIRCRRRGPCGPGPTAEGPGGGGNKWGWGHVKILDKSCNMFSKAPTIAYSTKP